MLSFFVIVMDMFVKTLTSREDPLYSPFVIADNLILLSIFSSSIGCPRIIRTCSFFCDFRHCAKTADVVVSKNFRITHQESKLNVTLSPSQHIIPFSHWIRLALGNRFSLFVQRPNRQQGIGKKRNPGFHNRPIGMIFAEEPKSKVWNQPDVSRTQIFQHFFFFFVCRRACAAFRLILINIAS